MKRFISALLAALLLAGLSLLAAAAVAGGADDPLVSLSCLKGAVTDKLLGLAEGRTRAALGAVEQKASQRLGAIATPRTGFSYAPKFTSLDFKEGGVLTLDEFCCFILFSGTGRLYITSGEVINISTGETCKSGELLRLSNKYFAAEKSSAYVRLYEDGSWGMADGYYKYEASGQIPLRESFLDVGEDHWAAEYIFELAGQGIVNGVGGHRFAPSAPVTRAAFVTILGRLCRADTSAYAESGFSDADMAAWYGPYVAWAAGAGLAQGDGGRFYPDSAITREQMAVIISRFAAYAGIACEGQGTGIERFADAGEISSWAAEGVVKAADLGIMTGKGSGVFDPKGTATRAELCAVAVRLVAMLEEAGG